MRKGKVLVTDDVHECLLQGLTALGFEYDYLPDMEQSGIEENIARYEGLVINSKSRANKEVFEKGKKLKFVARLGSGLEIIDLEAAQKAGVLVVSAPEGNAQAVGEHALGMLLGLFNKLTQCDIQVKNLIWNRESNRGLELKGKTIGIIGLGNNGSAFARLLEGFSTPVMAYDKYKTDFDPQLSFVRCAKLEEIYEEADIVSLHIPWNSETHHFVDEDFILRMKKPFFLVNTSRGGVADTRAVITGLDSGKIAGACMDVFENEKPGTYTVEESEMYGKLFSFTNVVVSPHVAGWSRESKERIANVLIEKIKTGLPENYCL